MNNKIEHISNKENNVINTFNRNEQGVKAN